ncbi:uncharacterized protein [Penaeus vannamei]|uniref:uncharacterized protein n=1 Tax=Penaeus vannamei TaxID=6689 RepID=UPI00387F82E8
MDVLKQIHRKCNIYHRYSILPLLLLLPSVVILIADTRRPQELKIKYITKSSRNLATCQRMFSLPRRSRLGPSSQGENPLDTGVHRPPWLTSDEYRSMGRSLLRSMREDAVKNNLSSPFSERNEENILRPFMAPEFNNLTDRDDWRALLQDRRSDRNNHDFDAFNKDSRYTEVLFSGGLRRASFHLRAVPIPLSPREDAALRSPWSHETKRIREKEKGDVKQFIQQPWDEFQATQDIQTVHQTHQVATSAVFPGLRVTFRFSQFFSAALFRVSEERKLLLAWINGSLPPPDLVVIGYGSWTLYSPQYLKRHIDNLDPLSGLLRIHQLVSPLLQKLSRKTLVLFHAESRQRPLPPWQTLIPAMQLARLGMFTDGLYDWSEMMIRYFLEKRSRDLWDQVRLLGRENLDGEDAEGVWWWDSTLPYHSATVLECNDLQRRNLTHWEEYRDPRNNCGDQVHAGGNTRYLEVIMLLNLLCNSHMASEDHFCCS